MYMVREQTALFDYINGILRQIQIAHIRVDIDALHLYISANLVFTDPTDKLAVERMVDKGPNEKVDLTCQSMSLINISHFKWRNDNYDILLGGKVVLKYPSKPRCFALLPLSLRPRQNCL